MAQAQRRLTNQNLRTFIDSTQGKSLTTAAVTALLVIVIFLLGIFPALSSILFQVEENGKREDGLVLIDQKRTTLRALASEESEKGALTRALNAYLPDELLQEDILQDLSELAEEHDLEVVAVAFGEIDRRRILFEEFDTAEALDGAVLTLSVEGEISDLQELIADIEETRRILSIRNLSLIRQMDSEEELGYKLDLQLEIYYWNTGLE